MKLATKKRIKEQTKTKKKENECQVSKLTNQNSRNWLQSETFAQSLQNVPAIDKWKVHLKKENEISNEQYGRTNRIKKKKLKQDKEKKKDNESQLTIHKDPGHLQDVITEVSISKKGI